MLAAWTNGAVGTLPAGPRTLFWLVCALEEADRSQPVVEPVWPSLWQRLRRPGRPPALQEALDRLVGWALLHVEQQGVDGPARYRVHPAVAEATRKSAERAFQAAVDNELAAYWQVVHQRALKAEGGEATGWVVRAGRGAAPYLLRLEDWEAAAHLLEQALTRDRSPASTQAVLPLLMQIAHATRRSRPSWRPPEATPPPRPSLRRCSPAGRHSRLG